MYVIEIQNNQYMYAKNITLLNIPLVLPFRNEEGNKYLLGSGTL